MLNNVKYYNRAFKLLDDLMYTYRNGYNKSEVELFLDTERSILKDNTKLFLERYHSLILTIVISLMGLNKEAIDNADKFINYSTFIPIVDFRKYGYYPIPGGSNEQIDEESVRDFNSNNTVSTPFECWLSVLNTPEGEDDKTINRRVRNGLLHSNFDLNIDDSGRPFTHIKTGNYFESFIFNDNFRDFVNAFYNNHSCIKEKDYMIILKKDLNVKSKEELAKIISNARIVFYKTKVDNYDGEVYFKKPFEDTVFLNDEDIKNGFNSLKEKGMNIELEYILALNEKTKDKIVDQILHFYPNFFEYDNNEKFYVIKNSLVNSFDPKESISNWLLHYMIILNGIMDYNIDLDDEQIDLDKFAKESSRISLLVLKSYLVMYRLQYIKGNNQNSNKFDDIDYNSINFDFNGGDYLLTVSNDNDSSFSFDTLVNRQLQRDENISREEASNRIICSIIRNGLAHGNIEPVYMPKYGEHIKIVDINPRNTDEKKVLIMTLDKFEKFLSSSTFLPKNCYNKTLSINLENN